MRGGRLEAFLLQNAPGVGVLDDSDSKSIRRQPAAEQYAIGDKFSHES